MQQRQRRARAPSPRTTPERRWASPAPPPPRRRRRRASFPRRRRSPRPRAPRAWRPARRRPAPAPRPASRRAAPRAARGRSTSGRPRLRRSSSVSQTSFAATSSSASPWISSGKLLCTPSSCMRVPPARSPPKKSDARQHAQRVVAWPMQRHRDAVEAVGRAERGRVLELGAQHQHRAREPRAARPTPPSPRSTARAHRHARALAPLGGREPDHLPLEARAACARGTAPARHRREQREHEAEVEARGCRRAGGAAGAGRAISAVPGDGVVARGRRRAAGPSPASSPPGSTAIQLSMMVEMTSCTPRHSLSAAAGIAHAAPATAAARSASGTCSGAGRIELRAHHRRGDARPPSAAPARRC